MSQKSSMQTERLSHCGTKAELRTRARVGRPQTSEAPHVKIFAGRPRAALLFWFFGGFKCGA